MRIISRGRQEGKTTEAVQWVKADPSRVLICPDERQADWTRKHFGLTDKQCMGVAASHSRLRGRAVSVGIDNIDLLHWRDLLVLGSFYQSVELVTETRYH